MYILRIAQLSCCLQIQSLLASLFYLSLTNFHHSRNLRATWRIHPSSYTHTYIHIYMSIHCDEFFLLLSMFHQLTLWFVAICAIIWCSPPPFDGGVFLLNQHIFPAAIMCTNLWPKFCWSHCVTCLHLLRPKAYRMRFHGANCRPQTYYSVGKLHCGWNCPDVEREKQKGINRIQFDWPWNNRFWRREDAHVLTSSRRPALDGNVYHN